MRIEARSLWIALFGFFASYLQSGAAVKQVMFTWKGDAGYVARISMSYDDTFPFVSAWGGGPFLGTATNQGISELSVTFLTATQTLLFSTSNVSNSVVTYRFLAIGFDTISETLVGQLDVGKDSFAEGEPGSSAGQFYLVSSPSYLISSFTGQPVDSGGEIVVAGPAAHPRLSLSMEGAASVRITWATNFVGYVLEYATNLPPARWSATTNSVALTDDRFSVSLDTDSEKRFFRLRNP